METNAHMSSLVLLTPQELILQLAARVKRLRLERGWTQAELAGRAGISLASYRRFERTGQISLERLIQLAVVLNAVGGVRTLFQPTPARSLDELEQREPTRQRGRSKRGTW